MHILIAPDSFKDALGAREVAEAFARGVALSCPDWTCTVLPLADGGEGTALIMTKALGGEMRSVPCKDPLGRNIFASYGWIPGLETAIIELAAASGIQLLSKEERNPLQTSTFGTGQQIRHAIESGAKHIYLTLGSSATNDAACGMAAALGFQFWAEDRQVLRPTGADLLALTNISFDEALPALKETRFTVLCDVNNPLYGARGAAHVYAKQKGADEAAIAFLDEGLRQVADILQKKTGIDLQQIAGSGAAGGAGGGAIAFFRAEVVRGIDAILHLCNFEKHLQQADLVVTGEGRIDEQTFTGKVVRGVTQACSNMEVPVIGICGLLDLDYLQVRQLGLQAAFPISNGARSLEKAIENTAEDVERLGAHLAAILASAPK
jgi:glycerate 2-kinase